MILPICPAEVWQKAEAPVGDGLVQGNLLSTDTTVKPLGRLSIRSYLLLPGLICLASGALIWLQIMRLSDGARLEPGGPAWSYEGMIVAPLRTEAGGLRRGDIVVAVAGKRMEVWAQALFRPDVLRPAYQVGDPVLYTVLRNGERLNVQVTLGRYPPGMVLMRHWSVVLFAVITQLITLFVLVRRPVDVAARALFVWAWSLPLALTWLLGLHVYDVVSKNGFWLFTVSTSGAWLLSWGAILHFALVFPQPHFMVLERSRTVPFIYAMPFVLYFTYLAVTWSLAENTLDWLRLWRGGDWFVAIVYLAMAIIVVVQQHQASHGVTRCKIRWLVFAALLSLSANLMLWFLPITLLGRSFIGSEALGLLALPYPIALGVALLRHRLFDIDIIIRRTLVYGVLTMTLTALYLVSVILLEQLLHLLVGQGHNPLAISLATLAIAALFRPLRSRIQRFIDQRFYRPKYDVEQVLAAFHAKIRDETDLERLSEALVNMVVETLHPAQVSIWLKEKRRTQTAEQRANRNGFTERSRMRS